MSRMGYNATSREYEVRGGSRPRDLAEFKHLLTIPTVDRELESALFQCYSLVLQTASSDTAKNSASLLRPATGDAIEHCKGLCHNPSLRRASSATGSSTARSQEGSVLAESCTLEGSYLDAFA